MGDWKKTLTAHMVVMNEEKWIWYSIASIIDYVDYLIIYDTGSTDNTVKIIDTFIDGRYHDKISFSKKGSVTREQFVSLRNEQVQNTKTDYFLVVDGDEVYFRSQMIELREALDSDEQYDCGIMSFVCCAGDVFHYRDSSRQHYRHGDKTGAITMRVFPTHIGGGRITCGDSTRQWDGYYDVAGTKIAVENGFKVFWGTGFYLHMSYMQRSSSMLKDAEAKWPSGRMGKLRTSSTWDFKFPDDFKYPEAFYLDRPSIVDSPWEKQKNLIRIFLQMLKNVLMELKGH